MIVHGIGNVFRKFFYLGSYVRFVRTGNEYLGVFHGAYEPYTASCIKFGENIIQEQDRGRGDESAYYLQFCKLKGQCSRSLLALGRIELKRDTVKAYLKVIPVDADGRDTFLYVIFTDRKKLVIDMF